jgi:CRISPR-associated exonuclease Cas4
MKISGTHINYYFVCKRELWFFLHGIHCEHQSDLVRMGRLLHEKSYSRENKEIDIDSRIVLDWFDARKGIVHEIKKSDTMEEAHEWQILYYLWYLKNKGLQIAENEAAQGIYGELDYPLLKKKKAVYLSENHIRQLEQNIIPAIQQIAEQPYLPPTTEWKVCKTCSYSDLCYS